MDASVDVGGRAYRVRSCRPTTGDAAWQVRRRGGDLHRVEYGPFGAWSCCCQAWFYRKKCSHVEAVREAAGAMAEHIRATETSGGPHA